MAAEPNQTALQTLLVVRNQAAGSAGIAQAVAAAVADAAATPAADPAGCRSSAADQG